MANIMINKTCNLKCPYCFANEFVNKLDKNFIGKNDISVEDFKLACDFITRTQNHIGLIGGEPLLHRNFKDIIEYCILNNNLTSVTLFTNGIFIDEYINLLVNNKISILVNVNSPQDIGENNFNKIINNLDTLIFKFYKNNITLGINIYKEDFDYSYILPLLSRYKLKSLRIAITVPNSDSNRNIDSLEYFRKIKPVVFNLFNDLLKIGVVPNYDCNLMPVCLYEDEDYYILDALQRLSKETGASYNLKSGSACSPVIDVLPDLQVVRCFGMSDFEKVHLFDFDTIEDICNYYYFSQDVYSHLIPISKECLECKHFQKKCCMQGCLSYKRNKITNAKHLIGRV